MAEKNFHLDLPYSSSDQALIYLRTPLFLLFSLNDSAICIDIIIYLVIGIGEGRR